MYKKIFKVVKSCDMFGQPVSLNIKDTDTFKTLIGGLSSIVMMIIMLLIV